MQQTGCLKKRRKRNIAKVSGLGLTPYDEEADNFTGRSMYDPSFGINLNPNTTRRTSQATSVNMTSYRSTSRQPGNTKRSAIRITRQPAFHTEVDESFGQLPNYDNDDDDEEAAIESNFDFQDGINFRSEPVQDHTRPYFFNKKTMTRLRQLLILGMTSGAFPWVWNKKENRIDKFSPKMEKYWWVLWALTTVQTCFLTGYQVYVFFGRQSTTPEGEQKQYREVFMMSFSLFWYVCAVAFNLNMYLFKDGVRQYINSLLHMNKRFVDRYVINADNFKDSGSVLMNVSIPTNTIQVFISVSLFLRVPYKPWFLYSYIYKDENPWYWLIPGGLQEFILVGQVITSYMLISWIIVVHINSVGFWLREGHKGNDTGFTMDEMRDPNHALRIYRSLQILCKVFNDCMSTLALPFVKIHIWAGIIPTGYVLIRSSLASMKEEFPGIMTYPFAVLDCVSGGFAILAVAAEMYDLGVSFVDSWSRTKQKDFRRILMSCPTLQVRVGRFYSITISTTITFFKSVIDYIIDCVITFP